MSSSSVVVLTRTEVGAAYECYVDLDQYLAPAGNAIYADPPRAFSGVRINHVADRAFGQDGPLSSWSA
jgi:hypothetical protein